MRRAWVLWPREAFESMDEGPDDASVEDEAPAVKTPPLAVETRANLPDSPRVHIVVRTRDRRPEAKETTPVDAPPVHEAPPALELNPPTDPIERAAGEARALTVDRMCWLCALTRGEDGWVTPCCGSTSAHRECYDRMVEGGISCVLCPQNKSVAKTLDCQCRVA